MSDKLNMETGRWESPFEIPADAESDIPDKDGFQSLLRVPGAESVAATQPNAPAEPQFVTENQPFTRKRRPDQETMRRVAWEIGEKSLSAQYQPTANHVALHYVSPAQGFAHWRILQSWIDKTARERGGAWHNCRMILRFYDVSYIVFNGFNAHRIQNIALPQICGHIFFGLPRPGTFQLAEVGFELRSGEFVAAARSLTTQFPPDAISGRSAHAALLVDDHFHIEPIESLWEQEAILVERKKPKIRKPLRIATFAFESAALGQQGVLPTFVHELAAHQRAAGHEVYVFAPQNQNFTAAREVSGVQYHPLGVNLSAPPIELAAEYAHAVEKRITELTAFDLFHVHEWIAGLAPWLSTKSAVLSLSSTESSRLNGAEPSALSKDIRKTEREIAHGFECILVPDWLRDKAIPDLGVDATRIHSFPMEGRLANECEAPLDPGKVKIELGFGPLDRLLLFVGPLEHAAGPDLLVDALPVALGRCHNLRIAFVGSGSLHDHLYHRANELHVGHAIRVLTSVNDPLLKKAFRVAQALVLPSRHRVAGDDHMVTWARRAGRPVVTTHGGPSTMVRHEENGIVTYDNPGSMVWALDRILGDPANSDRLGRNGKQQTNEENNSWTEVARRYLELCAATFPELT